MIQYHRKFYFHKIFHNDFYKYDFLIEYLSFYFIDFYITNSLYNKNKTLL